MTTRLGTLLLTTIVVLGACASPAASTGPSAPSGSSASGTKVTVVTTTTVFADIIRNVGGDFVDVSSLVPANGDVHTFSPRPSDIRTLSAAKLVVMNGLDLDDWLTKTIESVANHAPVVQLAVDLPSVAYEVGEEPAGPANPHLWMNVAYAQLYVDRIAAALAQTDPPHASAYDAQGKAYRNHLGELDAYVKQQISFIPAANRRFVAFHDAFPYFAKAYGLETVGVAVEAPGQDPSAGYTAQLIAAIRAAHVKAIFSEAQFPPKLVEQLAQETGASVVATLYDDSIGDPPITSYEAVIRWDTDEFVKALS
jgi:ABC-type Zn uptake system ZnuABC Zn-binding protein ZnuA